MASIFSRIIAGEIPSAKIREDDRFFAFLDIRPINPGHTLVVPRVEIDELFDLAPDLLEGMLPFAQPIARALKKVTGMRVGLLVAGLEVPHAHLHLIPIRSERDLDFSRARAADPEELRRMAEAVRAAL